MAQETVKQITQGGVTRPVEDEVARQKAGSAIQGVIVNGTEVTPDSSTKKVSLNIPAQAPVDVQMSGTSENAVQNKVIKAYVDNLISGLIDGAPQALDTLNELAAALNDNANFASAITQQLGTKQDTLVAGNGITIAQDGKTVSVDAAIRTNAGKGIADVSSPQEDGSFTITLANGDTYTVNLNHQHPQYQPLLSSANAGSNITITTDQQTGNIIISATGGGGGGGTQVQADWNQTDSTAVDFIKNKPTIPVVPTAVSSFTNDAGYITQQSLAGLVQSHDVVAIVKISQSAYDALQVKDSSTLYLITES